jgi:predicted Zn finger-like uncharacterized protein
MEISCNKCKTKLSVPDEKLPKGKAASVSCPKCKEKIIIDLKDREKKNTTDSDKNKFEENDFDETSEDYDATERPFDFLEEEGKTALLCEEDPKILKEITTVLEIMDYSITRAKDVREALRGMKYHMYDMVLVNETFGGSDPEANGILIYLDRLQMEVRRNVFVGLLTRQFSTMDNMTAFLKSVNLVINIKDIGQIDRILSRGINEFELFYAVFKDSAKRLGIV